MSDENQKMLKEIPSQKQNPKQADHAAFRKAAFHEGVTKIESKDGHVVRVFKGFQNASIECRKHEGKPYDPMAFFSGLPDFEQNKVAVHDDTKKITKEGVKYNPN